MPREVLLKKLDPLGTLSVPEVRDMLAPYVIKYQQLVLQDRPAADMDIKERFRFTIASTNLRASQGGVMFRSGALVKYASPIVCADAAPFSLRPYSIR
jgi:hypothetical protein